MKPADARRLWQLLEPYHAAVYFAPETGHAYGDAGLKGYWMGYFASRSAALGPVGPGAVTALFFNFAPRMVYRALPDAWSFSTPQRVLQARWEVADAALRRLFGDVLDTKDVAEAADLGAEAVQHGDASGRPLFGAHRDLRVPDQAHLRLWHAATCLREHRGDGHVALLLGAGFDGCEANVMAAAAGVVPRDLQRERRGWTEDEWAAAHQRLRARGLVDEPGELTAMGVVERDAIEARTDALAVQPYEVLGDDGVARLVELLEPLVRALLDSDSMPFPNPVGLPRPFG